MYVKNILSIFSFYLYNYKKHPAFLIIIEAKSNSLLIFILAFNMIK